MSEGLVYKRLEEIEQQVRLKIPIEHCEDIIELIDDVRILVEAKDVELKRREGDTQLDTDSKLHKHGVSNTEGKFCGCGTLPNELDVNGECIICGKKLNSQNYC